MKKSPNFIMIALSLVLNTFFSPISSADQTAELSRYSYCSNGRCSIITNDFFHQNRGMPRDMFFTCKKNNQYALTFDDGPSSNWDELLEILNKHSVKATFFVNGSNIKDNNIRTVNKAYLSGHNIANHTFNHADLTADSMSDTDVINQVQSNYQKITSSIESTGFNNTIAISAKIVRPPYGNINMRVDKLFKANGFYAVRWNADRYDWNLSDNDEDIIFQRVSQQLDFIDQYYSKGLLDTNSMIDLNHDFRKSTLKAIDKAIPLIKQRGYEFVTMVECLGLG